MFYALDSQEKKRKIFLLNFITLELIMSLPFAGMTAIIRNLQNSDEV